MRKLTPWLLAIALLPFIHLPAKAEDEIFSAARAGDLATVKRLVEAGAEIDATTQYGATPLTYACDKGKLEVVRYLVGKGADVNHQDTFYNAAPITWAAMNDHAEVVAYLLEHGVESPQGALMIAIQRDNKNVLEKVIATDKVGKEMLDSALVAATQQERKELVAILEQAGAEPPKPPEYTPPEGLLATYEGEFENAEASLSVTLKVDEEGSLKISFGPQVLTLEALDATHFRVKEMPVAKLEVIVGENGRPSLLKLSQPGNEIEMTPVADSAENTDESAAPDAGKG